MLSSADVNELKVPLGLYPSRDEPQDEVCRFLNNTATDGSSSNVIQYKKIVEIVSKKPFADKNDDKFYDTSVWVSFL